MNIPILIMMLSVLLGTLVACAPTTDTIQAAVAQPARPDHDLLGLWQLGDASQIKDIPPGITLAIREASEHNGNALYISGYAGINDYVSDALVDPSQQRFILSTKIGTTEKWGPLPRQDFEQSYLDALDGVVSYHLAAGSQLTLITLQGAKLQFRRVDN
jgi:heat shock protein HslJ